MMNTGTFTHIYHPNDEKMFDNASIDIIVFRYCKDNSLPRTVLYNNKIIHLINSDGLITFEEEKNDNTIMFKDYFDIYVGLVSGKENVYKNEELGNIEILNGYNKINKYIYINKFPCENKEVNEYLLKNKNELIKRKIRKFNEDNWFEWGAPRNINNIINNMGKECIYVYNITRKSNVAFLDKVNYFGGGLLMLIPKKKCNLINIVEYMNSDSFKNKFMFSNRFKIGHRTISNSLLQCSYI